MGRLTSTLIGLLALLVSPLLTTLVAAAAPSNGSTFVFTNNDLNNGSVVFALNVNKESGDLFFHMSAPAAQSWIGVGIGSQMKGATIFMAYASGNGTGVTLSPRIASGHTEPTYDNGFILEPLSGSQYPNANTVDDTNMVIDAVCRNCTQLLTTDLDLTSTAQPFIFAMGPAHPYASTSPSAGLWEHQYYGQFTVDMTKATSANTGSVPLGPYVQSGASQATSFSEDNDPGSHIHGAVMSFVFFILLPSGSLVLRVWNKVKGHAIVQCLALLLFCMAFAGGIVTSLKYNRSKNFNNAHQVIGMLLLVAFLSQLALGIVNHRIFRRTQQKTKFGKVHYYLGIVIIGGGIINGALGFRLAEIPELGLPYLIGVIVIGLIYTAIRVGCIRYRSRRNGRGSKGAGMATATDPDGFQFPQFGNTAGGSNAGAYPYANPPPAYGESETRIPLQTYQSSSSVQQLPLHPVEPRGMV